jgi:hypothetical protein
LGFAQWIASVKPEIASLKQSKVSLKCPKPTACRSIEASKGRWEPMRRSASSRSQSHVDRATYANKNCIRGMGMFRLSILAAAAVTLVSCATPYQDYGVLGGLDAKELRPDVDRVSFQGNGFTTRESVQVYWLNRCAELAIEKGYAGFEVLSDMQFVMHHPSSDDGVRLASFVPSLRSGVARRSR